MGERQPEDILGLSEATSEAELKRAYRRLASRWHPDRSPGDSDAAVRFREVSEAYAALSRRGRDELAGEPPDGVAAGFAFGTDAGFAFEAHGAARPRPAWHPGPEPLLRGQPADREARPVEARPILEARRGRVLPKLMASLCLVFAGIPIGATLAPGDAIFGAAGPDRGVATGGVLADGQPAAGPAGPPAARPRARVPAPATVAAAEPSTGLHAALPMAQAEQGPTAAVLAAVAPPDALPSLPIACVAASEGAPVARAVSPADAALFAALMRTGEAAMQQGDIAGARARYERAAALDPGSAGAAIAAGETHDPHVLALVGANSPWFANPARAAAWYERARELGDPVAPGLLARLR